MKLAAVALLVHQLMKHSQSEQGAASAGPTGGGGLGGILGSLLGKGGSAPTSTRAPGGGQGGILGGLLGGGALGGLGGLLGSLRSQGLGPKVDSWVAPGENQPVAPHELEASFDPRELDEAARHAGTDRGTLLNEMSQVLPGVVDRMTPQGRIPQREEDIHGGIGGLLGHLLGGGGR